MNTSSESAWYYIQSSTMIVLLNWQEFRIGWCNQDTTEWLGRHQYSRRNLRAEVLSNEKMTGHGGRAAVPMYSLLKLLDFSVTQTGYKLWYNCGWSIQMAWQPCLQLYNNNYIICIIILMSTFAHAWQSGACTVMFVRQWMYYRMHMQR